MVMRKIGGDNSRFGTLVHILSWAEIMLNHALGGRTQNGEALVLNEPLTSMTVGHIAAVRRWSYFR
jgi:hypothetical protein